MELEFRPNMSVTNFLSTSTQFDIMTFGNLVRVRPNTLAFRTTKALSRHARIISSRSKPHNFGPSNVWRKSECPHHNIDCRKLRSLNVIHVSLILITSYISLKKTVTLNSKAELYCNCFCCNCFCCNCYFVNTF